MTTQLLLFVAGLVGLVAGAELLVRGASRLALSFGISPLVCIENTVRSETFSSFATSRVSINNASPSGGVSPA